MHDVSLIIPAKKEPNALPMVLEEINKIKLSCEIIIIMDKSDVETYKAAKKFNCKIIFQSGRGYGNAIIEGILESNTKYSCIFYADGSTDPKFVPLMMKKLEDENIDFVFGSRYEKGAYTYDDDFITKFGNFFFTFLGNFLMKFKITDIMFTYIFSRTDSLKKLNLTSDDYCLCMEIPFKIKEKNYKYSTYPCVERKRFADKKKVKAFPDGFKILKYFVLNYLKFINRK